MLRLLPGHNIAIRTVPQSGRIMPDVETVLCTVYETRPAQLIDFVGYDAWSGSLHIH